mgnify:CR=1 FL=1
MVDESKWERDKQKTPMERGKQMTPMERGGKRHNGKVVEHCRLAEM